MINQISWLIFWSAMSRHSWGQTGCWCACLPGCSCRACPFPPLITFAPPSAINVDFKITTLSSKSVLNIRNKVGITNKRNNSKIINIWGHIKRSSSIAPQRIDFVIFFILIFVGISWPNIILKSWYIYQWFKGIRQWIYIHPQ